MVTAEEAAALEGAMEESAGLPPGLYFGIIWIIITAIVCLLVGFLIGTRARQIAASAKTLTSAFLHFSFKIPEGEASIIGKQDDDNGGEDDEKEEAEEGNANVDELDAFIQPADTDSTLQDHPDLTVNPVMTYKIKRAKDEARAMQRRLALIAEGFDEKEVDERMEIEGAGGGGGGGGKQNALATLIAVGANVEGKRGGASEENALLQERRRLQRNVDAYLKTSEGIEKFKGDAKPSGAGKARDATGGRIKTASEVATETSHTLALAASSTAASAPTRRLRGMVALSSRGGARRTRICSPRRRRSTAVAVPQAEMVVVPRWTFSTRTRSPRWKPSSRKMRKVRRERRTMMRERREEGEALDA